MIIILLLHLYYLDCILTPHSPCLSLPSDTNLVEVHNNLWNASNFEMAVAIEMHKYYEKIYIYIQVIHDR